MNQEHYMRLALAEAEKAAAAGEIPVGAVVVCGDTVLAAAHNDREATHSPLGHAEVRAIEQACRARGDWRLEDCTLYVTLEPCPMCAGAIINSRIKRVIFGARDEKSGAVVSRERMFSLGFNHVPKVTEGVMEEECAKRLSEFFSALREKRRKR